MISVCADVWEAFLSGKESVAALETLLEQGVVSVHPYVYGELVLRSPGTRREEFLRRLQELVRAPALSHDEVMAAVQKEGLQGVGYVDAHVLASAQAKRDVVWALAPAVSEEARRLGAAFDGRIRKG